ncbi:MAG TPA: hypothetical protein VG944_21885 [Fimbriimonas sp.]|nr:hypothetical protein [Fimbriimonas sp.]
MRLIASAALAIIASVAVTQHWEQSYSDGLKAAKAGHWLEARDDFRRASADRSGDSNRGSSKWRKGALYSPLFLSAYCSYRSALDVKDPGEQKKMLRAAASEFEGVVAKGERSRDAYFFLTAIYAKTGDGDKLRDVQARSASKNGKVNWSVDEEILAPQELSAMSVQIDSQRVAVRGGNQNGDLAPVLTAAEVAAQQEGERRPADLQGPEVPPIPDKYALVIGETGEQLGEGSVPFATYDAQKVADGLTSNAGYDAENVVVVMNGSAAKIAQGAKALAAKVPQDGTVAIYYAGPGACVNGKDYLVGSDSVGLTDPETMVAKSALYNLFMQRGARIFAFFEVNRPVVNGYFFGSEVPQVGAIAQMEATIPEGTVTSLVNNGHIVGLFAESFWQVLAELRSNRVPIYEFGWQIYNKMRKGNSGTSSGSSHQIPTLPVLNNLAADARF